MKKIALLFLFAAAFSLSAVEIPLRNPQFKSADGKITHWASIEPGAAISSVPYPDAPDTFAVRISSDKATKYFGVVQGGFDLSRIPRPQAGEKLQFTLKFRQKNENVGNGGFFNISFFSAKGYLVGRDSAKRSGSFDWEDIETSVVFNELPSDVKFMQVRFFLGKTTGTVYFAEPKLYVNVIKK